MNTLDRRFSAAGEDAVRKHPNARLVATANELDKFTLWASGLIDDGIVGAVDVEDDEHADWLNSYVHNKEARHPNNDRYREEGYRPYCHPFVRAIAERVYKELHEPLERLP